MKKYMLIVLLVAAGSLRAAVITNTATVSMVNGNDATVSLAKFNSSLGKLTSIRIDFMTGIHDATFEFDNDSVVARNNRTVDLTLDVALFSTSVSLYGTGINLDGSALYIYDSTVLSVSATKGDSTTQFNNTGLSDYAIWNLPTQTATTGGNVDSSVFSDYTGSGNFTATLNSAIYYGFTPVALLRAQEVVPADFTATVVYNYEAIPEPAAIGLIGIGGIVTLVANRFARSIKQNRRMA